jgi:EAL domain-containing protein (putative c-di-GMP-specific phosphodiesterase class I)
MVDPERAVEVLELLSAAGFGLSIDDFGTGYSSLSYLKRFAADHIKIDISFVRHMLSDSNDHTIVTTIIAMARSLGMKTTAEGVEEAGQAAALLELGCDSAQGYHFGRPEPPEAFLEKWLRPSTTA